MMTSILIPTHNKACTPLVAALAQQAAGLDVEIVVAEDGTTDPVALASNRWIADMPQCRYLPLTTNHGRAAIRNLLATEARGERLLFVDDDVMPADDDFLKAYLSCNAPVVCGGLLAAKTPHPNNLRWRYDHSTARRLTVEHRKRAPYKCFMTSNFAVARDLFLDIRLDESITDYGFEDALFGIMLQKRAVPIAHIHAPVHHNGLESNAQYVAKVEQAMRTLHALPQMQPHAPVARAAARLRPVAALFKPLRPLLRWLATCRRPQVWALQAYKLCYYLSIE